MKTLEATDLPTLPAEVKDLVQEGVYALYALKASTRTGGAYLLVTRAHEVYVLSPGGAVVETGQAPDLSSFEVLAPVTFAGSERVRLNQAS